MAEKTVAEWIDGLGLTIDSTVSKKAASAKVKKKYKPSSFGFDKHGEKIAHIDAWAVAELDGVEYKVIVHTPKSRAGGEPVAKTFYKKA
jgi:hypothetical protein